MLSRNSCQGPGRALQGGSLLLLLAALLALVANSPAAAITVPGADPAVRKGGIQLIFSLAPWCCTILLSVGTYRANLNLRLCIAC
jgi:hypothetical protein